MKTTYRIVHSLLSISASLAMLALAIWPSPVVARSNSSPATQKSEETRAYHPQTGKLTFLGTDPGHPIGIDAAMRAGLTIEKRALAVLEAYSAEFGIGDPAKELTLTRISDSDETRSTLRYQQVYQGIPVIGGELVVNIISSGGLLSINGEVSPALSIPTEPRFTAEQTRDTALSLIASRYSIPASELNISEPGLWIFDERLLRDSNRPAELVWRVEVSAVNQPLRELVLVNAQTGGVSLHFNQIDTAWTMSGSSIVYQYSHAGNDSIILTPIEKLAANILPKTDEVIAQQISGNRYVSLTGSDNDNCIVNPCATINYAISQAVAGDNIYVAIGIYQSTGTEVVLVNKNVNISGGWNGAFDTQSGFSVIDGESARVGFRIGNSVKWDVITELDRFIVRNSTTGILADGSTSTLIVRNSSVILNSGTGIFGRGVLEINNVTASHNDGAGISHAPSYLSPTQVANIRNSTIAHNGTGIITGAKVFIENSISSGNATNNSPKDCARVGYNATITSEGYNIVGNTTSCGITPTPNDKFNVDPMLNVLLPELGVHPLFFDSPAIDAGNPATCFTKDQRGANRFDGDGDSTIVCDIGAIEYQTPGLPSIITKISGDKQQATPGYPFRDVLSAVILDDTGNPVPNIEITFTSPITGASGFFINTGTHIETSITDNGGISRSSTFIANNETGSFSVTASSPGLNSIDYQFENLIWYTSPTGNDNNDCKSAITPCATINGVISKAMPGDTVYVSEGTYFETFSISKDIRLLGGWDLAFTNQTGLSTIDAQHQGTWAPVYVLAGASVEIDHFGFTNAQSNYYGGGLSNLGNLIIRNSKVTHNQSNYGGGISNSGQLLIESSSISNNSAFVNGGGIYNTGTLTIKNSTISQNSGIAASGSGNSLDTLGGGLYSIGNTNINNVTISNNIAEVGGGIWGAVTLENSIIADNLASSPDCSGSLISSGHNIISSTLGCTITAKTGDKFNTDAQLGPFIEAVGFQPISANSPAKDAGNPATCEVTDQRGVIRMEDSACDIGAFEYSTPGPLSKILILGGNLQSAFPNTPFIDPLKAVVTDEDGDPVSGVTVTIASPETGPSLIFANGTRQIITLVSEFGVATTSNMTATDQFGDYTVIITVNGYDTAAEFLLSNAGWFVSPDGSDSNNCKFPITPCRHISHVLGKIKAGETVFAAGGTYTEPIETGLTIDKDVVLSGGWNSAFTIQEGLSIIDGKGVRPGVAIIDGITVKIEEFSIQRGYGYEYSGIINSGDLTIDRCAIQYNRTDLDGGGIVNKGNLVITNSTISRNQATFEGGGIYNRGTLTLQNVILEHNTVIYPGGGVQTKGGGVANHGNIIINKSTISNNKAFKGGGIYNEGQLTVNYSSLSNNEALSQGGGIASFYDDFTKINSTTLAMNRTNAMGGAIFGYQSNVTLNNVTVSYNSSSYRGGGIYWDPNSPSGSITIKNSIVSNNTAKKEGQDCFGKVKSGNNNIVRTTSNCTISPLSQDRFNINPVLGIFLSGPGYVPLMASSPAINTGNPSSCVKTDQRGVIRSQCDIGAYEYKPAGTVASLAVNIGDDQHATPSQKYVQSLQAIALDKFGTPVKGIKVKFSAPTNGPGGKFSKNNSQTITVTTNTAGIADAGLFIANDQRGEFYVIASANGIGKTVHFALTNILWFITPFGTDTNACNTPLLPCANINSVVDRLDYYPGDTAWVSTGNFTDPDNSFYFQGKTADLIGGWSLDFATKNGTTTLNDRVDIENGSIYFKNFTFHNNSGMGLSIIDANVIIENSSIINNKSGGMKVRYGRVSLVNVTLSGNSGRAAIENDLGNITISNSTIANNNGNPGSPGGIYNSLDSNPIVLQNTIIIGNKGNAPANSVNCQGKFISKSNNLIGNVGKLVDKSYVCDIDWAHDDLWGDNTHQILLSEVLQSTITKDPSSGQWVHPLKLGSLAIDRGNPLQPGTANSNACPATDQRGVARPQNTRCDIGAYEYEFQQSSSLLIRTYTANKAWSLPGTLVCDQNDPNCSSGDAKAKSAHKFAIGTYNFFKTKHGRNSIDGEGIELLSSVHYGQNYKNAFWNGHMMVYGDGYGFPLADDVVAHELTHGITQYESNLFYYYQSGAINESFSDLWGEAFDQTNGQGNDSAAVKWLIGEDVSGLGAIRNMKNPPAFKNPDRMLSNYYYLGSEDNGGVHTNSGVNNKAVYLLVNGGAFNGKTISALGWNKILAIYYDAQANLLTSGADYYDLYFALYQACQNVKGINGITQNDCIEVREATQAVQMDKQPNPKIPSVAPLCPAGMTNYDVFSDDFEKNATKWTLLPNNNSAWQLSSGYSTSGTQMIWADDAYTSRLSALQMKNSVTLPKSAQYYLHFKHAFGFEHGTYQGTMYYFDGGVVEYSVDNGKSWKDASTLIDAGVAYTGTVSNYTGTTNKLKGKNAFVGESQGYLETRLNLKSLAGKSVRLRWQIGTDKIGYDQGWFIDDVRIYTCLKTPSRPVLTTPTNNARITDYTPKLDWKDSAPDLDHYQLQIATDNAFKDIVLDNTTIKASAFTMPSNLSPAQAYFWRVRAFNAAGKASAWSSSFSFKTLTAAPKQVAPVNNAILLNNSFQFKWQIVTGATSYALQVSNSSTFNTLLINKTQKANIFDVTDELPAKTTLYWRVRSNSPVGAGKWSPTRSFQTANPPGIPALVSPADGSRFTETSPQLDWSNSTLPFGTQFDHYQVQVANSGDFSSPTLDQNVAGRTQSFYTPAAPLNAGLAYYWRVRSYNTAGQYSNWSAILSFGILPVAPTLLAPADQEVISTLQPIFDWEDVAGAADYSIQVARDLDFTDILVDTVTATSDYSASSDLPTGTLYWRVRANSQAGPGDWTTFSFAIQ